jgi:hypothetical protein
LGSLLLFFVAGSVSFGAVAYVETGNSQFGTMNLETGAFTLIGVATAAYGDPFGDITQLNGGPLYGSDYAGNLLLINPKTGSSSVIGNMGPVSGLKVSKSGELFGYSYKDLFTVDASNGESTLIGPFGIDDYYESWDATFDGDTMYFMADQYTNDYNANLYTVDTSTGEATLVGDVGYFLNALTFNGSTLYGFTGDGEIITIDTTTGAGTFLANERLVNDSVVTATKKTAK